MNNQIINKELQFCISNKEKIIRESERIYTKQINSGKVYFSYCDFKKLEETRDNYTTQICIGRAGKRQKKLITY